MPQKRSSENTSPSRKVSTSKMKRKRPILRVILLSMLLIVLISGVVLCAFTIKAAAGTPEWKPELLNDQKQSSLVFDSEGNQIAQLHQSENRLTVAYEDIPKLVRDTFIAVEDKRFFEHFGADPIRILKALINNMKSGSAREGGSTITIQLAKLTFIENPYSKKLERKIQELMLALQIERGYTKEEILTFYLNRISLGENSFGIRAAAQTYFGKELDELNPAEAAMLAGLPQAPSAYDPYVYPDKAKNRRNVVLGVMEENGIIDHAEFLQYKDEPFTFVEEVKAGTAEVSYSKETGLQLQKDYPYFVDFVIAQMQNELGFSSEEVYSGGLKIHTTVIGKVQREAERAFADSDNFPSSVDDIPVQGSLTMVENATGAIVSMVGGRNYTPMGLNRAWQSPRQPGSSIKPLTVYAPALDHGDYFPGTVYDDMPVTYHLGGGSWSPVNYDTETSGWKGLITMREAVRNSVNVYAVKLMNDLGIEYCWNFAKNNLGLPLEERSKVLSLSLGVCELTTLDMAAAYSTFPNNGVRNEAYCISKIEDATGKIIYERKDTSQRVMKETSAYIMNDLLRTVVTSGTGTRAQIGNWYICGKTGTSSLDPDKYGHRTGNPDAWFAGYSPLYTAVVWMGYDKDEDLKHYLYQQYGGNYPARLWKSVMTVALEDFAVQSSIAVPAGIGRVSFDLKSGLLPSGLTPDNFKSSEICTTESMPTGVSDVWVEVLVDPQNPDLLAPEGASGAEVRVCLSLPGRSENAVWPSHEAAYKIPTEYSETMDDYGIEEDGSPAFGDHSIPRVKIGNQSFDEQTTALSITILSDYDEELFYPLLFIQDPSQAELSYMPESLADKTLHYTLGRPESLTPGEYVFRVSLVDKESFTLGPKSAPIVIQIPGQAAEQDEEPLTETTEAENI